MKESGSETNICSPESQPEKKRRGRPRKPELEKAGHLPLSGPIPEFIGFADLKGLIRQYRGRGYDDKQLRLWIETGEIPSYVEDGIGTAWESVLRRSFKWPEVRAWIDARMRRAVPTKGVVLNGKYLPPPADQ